MTRRPRKRPTPQTSVRDHHASPFCRAVVLVDGTAIRQKIKQDYEKARRDLANSKEQLDRFHQTDLPQFTQWLNTNFGALLTELRELSQRLAADEDLIFRVENEVFFQGTTHARAYKRVMESRDHPKPPPPGDDHASSGNHEPFEAPPGVDDFEGAANPMDAFFNALFGEAGPGERPGEDDYQMPGRHAKSSGAADPSARVKELYRALARLLHPDTQQAMTAQKAEWWHQTQEAYQAGDAGQLEVILTLCEIGENGTTANTSASLLQRITAQLKTSLREIKRQVAKQRQDPAWRFSVRTDREALGLQVRRNLQSDLQHLEDRWRETQNTLAGWTAAAERIKPKRPRKPRDCGTESLF